MAINRVTYPSTPTPASGDWGRIVDLMQTNYLLTEGSTRIDRANDNVLKGAVFQIGGVVYLADADTAITGTPSDYVKITPGGSTASAAYVTDLTDVTWNAVYNGYYDVSGSLYVFSEIKAILAGEISAAATRIGKAYEDMLAASSISFTGTDSDRTINFASDASLKWDESADIFKADKYIATPAQRYASDDAKEEDIFDALDKYIPNTDDTIQISGSLGNIVGTTTITVFITSYAKRSSADEITLYGLALGIETNVGVVLDTIAATVSCTEAYDGAPILSGGSINSLLRTAAIAWG